MKRKAYVLVFSLIIVILALSGCNPVASPQPTATPTPEPSPTPTPTPTPEPSPTSTLSLWEQAVVEKLQKTPLSDVLDIYDYSGEKVDIAQFSGHVLIINLFATWCAPCQDEMPIMQQAYEKLARYGIKVIEVSTYEDQSGKQFTDSSAQKVQEFMTENGYTMPTYIDWKLKTANNLDILSIPVTIVVDAEMNIRLAYPGAFTSYEQITQTLGLIEAYGE